MSGLTGGRRHEYARMKSNRERAHSAANTGRAVQELPAKSGTSARDTVVAARFWREEAQLPCLSSAELCCGRCKTIAPETRRPMSSTAPTITILPMASRRCRRTTLGFHAKPSRSLVRHSLETLDGRSWPLKASRRRSAYGLDPEQQRRDQEIEAARSKPFVRFDQWQRGASARRYGSGRRPQCSADLDYQRRRWVLRRTVKTGSSPLSTHPLIAVQ